MKILFYIIFSSLRMNFLKFSVDFLFFVSLGCVEDGFDNFGVRLILGKKILKPSWFDHAFCGVALGFVKDHQTRDSFVRCLLCKQDARIASRGITTFFEHCRGMRHHRLDCLVRLRRGLALRKRDGTLMSESESEACAAMLVDETVPIVESCPSVTVIEALQTEAAGRSVWGELRAVDDNQHIESVRLFVCLVADAIYRDCDFSSVTHLWDLMVSSNSQHAVLFGAACREADVLVIIFDVLYFILYVTCICGH